MTIYLSLTRNKMLLFACLADVHLSSNGVPSAPIMPSLPSIDPVTARGTEAPIPMVSGHKLQRATFHTIHHQP